MGMAAMLVMWPNSFVWIFIPILPQAIIWIWFQITQLFMRKTSFNFEIWVIFDQGQRMTLTFDLIQRH